jgi:hypothetical protein
VTPKPSPLTIATDAETKQRVGRYAQAAGLDVSTYVSIALHEAMRRDDQAPRPFAALDAEIDAAEAEAEAVHSGASATGEVTPEKSEAIARALDECFPADQRRGDAALS